MISTLYSITVRFGTVLLHFLAFITPLFKINNALKSAQYQNRAFNTTLIRSELFVSYTVTLLKDYQSLVL